MGVVVAFEGFGDLQATAFHQLVHVASEALYHAAGKAYSHRLSGVLKVVHIPPVRRDGLLGRDRLHVRSKRGVATGAWKPGDKQIEARLFDVQAQLQGADRTLLADRALQGRYLVRRLEPQIIGVAHVRQLLARDSQIFDAHGIRHLWSGSMMADSLRKGDGAPRLA